VAPEPRLPAGGRLASLNVGRARPLQVGGRRMLSGIGKRPVDGLQAVGPLGVDGDEQADLAIHGGLAKAVYAYPAEHLPFWRTVRAQAGVSLWGDGEDVAPGLLGENLTLEGLLEEHVCVGDVLAFPDCALAVSEPRFPCGKLGAALGFPQAVGLMEESGWCGFYLTVRTPGTLAAGQRFRFVPGPREVTIPELFRARVGRGRGRRRP
jgi:MOSC domain-containing protein YiiM